MRVFVDYGLDHSYGETAEAELRELITHVPVWNGQPGPIAAARTLNADQFFVHAFLDGLAPGDSYHYRFRYVARGKQGTTPDAVFTTAPERRHLLPFTFTAFGDETVADYSPIGYGGLVKRFDLPRSGPRQCPSVYSFRYANVGIVSIDANDLSSWPSTWILRPPGRPPQ